jgi:hypothetical protein
MEASEEANRETRPRAISRGGMARSRRRAISFEGHANAWWIGRELAGNTGEFSEKDLLKGRGYKDVESDFLANFLYDIESGRYTDDETGDLRANLIDSRYPALYREVSRNSERRFRKGVAGRSRVLLAAWRQQRNIVTNAPSSRISSTQRRKSIFHDARRRRYAMSWELPLPY